MRKCIIRTVRSAAHQCLRLAPRERSSMHRSLAAAAAMLIAAAVLCAASTASEAARQSCRSKLTACYKACDGHVRDDYKRYCDTRCRNDFNQCLIDGRLFPKSPKAEGSPGAKADGAKPKKGIDGTQPPTGTWVPSSSPKAASSTRVPVGGTWKPSPGSGGNGPILRSGSGQR